MLSRTAALSLAVTLLGSSATSADTKFAVDPEAGNNTFSAVFDAAIGERITAVSSAVACTLTVDADGAPDVELGACALHRPLRRHPARHLPPRRGAPLGPEPEPRPPAPPRPP